MRGVLAAPPAVFAELHSIWVVLLVLHGGVVAPLTDAASEADDVFHSQIPGLRKKKA
jgi:hypothetical protein